MAASSSGGVTTAATVTLNPTRQRRCRPTIDHYTIETRDPSTVYDMNQPQAVPKHTVEGMSSQTPVMTLTILQMGMLLAIQESKFMPKGQHGQFMAKFLTESRFGPDEDEKATAAAVATTNVIVKPEPTPPQQPVAFKLNLNPDLMIDD